MRKSLEGGSPQGWYCQTRGSVYEGHIGVTDTKESLGNGENNYI